MHRATDVGPLVLLVDDDPDVRTAIADVLEALGVAVVDARDGLEALQMLRSGLRPRLALVDLLMPRMNGEQLIRTIRRWRWTLPVASMSAGEGRLWPPLVECHLRKPFELETLEALVRRHCSDRCDVPASRP